MADAYSRPDYWTDMLPQSWQHSINTNPILNALGRALNRRPADIEGASKRIFAQPGDREMDDRAWLLQQAQPQRRLNPLAAEMLDKGGLLANFLGPSVKLPGVPRAPGRYAMEYPGGRIDYKDMDGGVHVSGIYTNPEARGQGNAKQALQELIAAADAAKRPMSLEISPGAPGVDPARLRQWYESLGFSGPDYAMTRQPPPAGIRAYHGSPHDFDKFDISKIGTGEGAQAYGPGLYFSESPAVARSYEGMLAGNGYDPAVIARDALEKAGRDPVKAMSVLTKETPPRTGVHEVDMVIDSYSEAAEILKRHAAGAEMPLPMRGRMYEVNIKADPDQFLDWDKPLSQQPEARAIFDRLRIDTTPEAPHDNPAVNNIRAGLAQANMRRDDWQDALKRPETVQALRDAGIPGIKYLDQQSRVSGQGSRNYVVFDDKLIEILRKYGLLPPVAAGTAAALNQQEPAQ
ncbi:MAG: hypothetical protein IPK59_23310 [Rhodospirillaceae bacterium]|nr:hypothetical protein [Rhodospirillaceae bacterium]